MAGELLAIPAKATEAQTAELLGVSVATLRRQERAGRIRAFRPSPRRVFYLESEITRFMLENGSWAENEHRCTDTNPTPLRRNIGSTSDRTAAAASSTFSGTIAELGNRSLARSKRPT